MSGEDPSTEDVNSLDDWPGQMIHQAAIYNNSELMQCLLEGDEVANINNVDSIGRTAVYTAVTNQSMQCLKHLIQHGANINLPGGSKCQNNTPLHIAVKEGLYDMVVMLLEAGADINVVDKFNMTPLKIAELKGDLSIYNCLNAENAKRDVQWKSVAEDFLVACRRRDVSSAEKLREELGSRAESVIDSLQYNKALSHVCKSGEKDLVRILLTIDLETDCTSYGEKSPLHLVCEYGHLEVAILLLEKCSEHVATRCPTGKLALHYAAMNGKLDIVVLLFEFPYPDHVLMEMNQNFGSIRQHFHHAFDPNTLDFDSKSALYYACENGHYNVVKYMVHRQVMACRTCDPLPPQIQINSRKDSETVMTMSQIPSMMHVCKPFNSNGLSPLHVSVLHNFEEIVSILLETGTSADSQPDPNEMTFALKTACDHGFIQLMDLLQQYGAKDDRNHILLAAEISHDVDMLGVILKYKTVADPHCHVDRARVRQKAAELSLILEVGNEESFNSLDFDGQQNFPLTPVSICWQDLHILTYVHMSWLVSAALYHNSHLNSSQSQLSLCSITRINIEHNRLQEFPSILFGLTSLCYLDVSHNDIGSFPVDPLVSTDQLWPNLVKLDISYNRFFTLPGYIFHLPVLFYLNASHNCLENVPDEFWFSTHLENVNFSNNNLRSFVCPASRNLQSVSNRKKVSTPSNSGGSVSSISSSDVFTLSHSESQNLDDYEESTFSNGMKMDVQHFVYWHTCLQVSTENVAPTGDENNRRLGLKVLNLSGNYLKEVPEGLPCYFPNLDQLNLSQNDIYSWGSLSYYPSMLRELDLSHNMLINMSDKQPSSLSTPDSSTCYNTKQSSTGIWRHSVTPSFSSYIQDINACPHRQHRILVNLQLLNLSYNRISSVIFLQSNNFWSTGGSSSSRNSGSLETTYGSSPSPGIPMLPIVIFPNLTTLDLSNNRLSNLTKDIGQLSQMKMLNISGNEIRELPPEMGLLKRLWKLDLDHCPLEGAVHDLMLQNRSAVEITGFLNSVLEAECEYSCLNLMLVGTHNVGKTSLLMQLRKFCKVPKDSRPKHWVERVGGGSPAKGKLLSTVGIDMDEVILDKSTKGPITFRTWDFGGQREYYATHRYFLLKRSLYLVIWKITDGEEGVNGMLQWLINIQSQAPGSSVIIIGTHLDILKNRATRHSFPKDFEEAMMKLISERYMVPEPDKCGLPNVIDAWNVSNITGNNVKKLLQRIYDQAFALRHPRSKRTLLLKQKIPKKYLYLQEIIQEIAEERKARGEDPVLSRELYKIQVMNKMMERIGTSFRDVAELDQATHFLHENGVLCHYEDVNLSDTYFLDPQWLCDQLAKVVTIREVNKFAINGVMFMKDLGLLYKSLSRTNHSGSQGYMLDLLGKFELALQFDKDKLLVPSLLPVVPCEKQVRVKLKVEDEDSDDSGSGSNEFDMDPMHYFGNSTFYLFAEESSEKKERARSFTEGEMKKLSAEAVPVTWERCQFEPIHSMCRLYQLMYFPSGFWPRVITRLLADKRIHPIAKNLFDIENCCAKCKGPLRRVLVNQIRWRCWQKQIELVYGNHVILSVKEAGPDSPGVMCDFSHCSVLCHMGQRWEMLDLRRASVLELCFPTNRYVLDCYHLPQSVINGSPVVKVKNTYLHSTTKKSTSTQTDNTERNCDFCGNQTPSQVTIVRREKSSSKLLARVIEHVDNLLQDWYPELGEQRFIQNIHGQYLVSRLVPCLCCLTAIYHNQQKNSKADKESWILVNNLVCESELSLSIENSVEEKPKDSLQPTLVNSTLHCFLVEECMLNVLDQKPEMCPVHGNLSQYWVASQHELHKLYLAPDIVFRDIDESLLLAADQITQVESLGKGAFGVVCRGSLHRENMPVVPCAIKNLSDNNQQTALPFSETIDHRMFAAVHAYTAARQEIEILQSLHNPNIVELLGIVVHPLALVLALAPHSSLNTILKVYRDKQDMLPVFAVKCVISQIASALSYLHSKGIIYRDLKSENVLVWSFPFPSMTKPEFHVDVRLADYGISRMSLPSGTKGFGGTPPFIAPEILQHAGKDIYTDKVDSFSFGMFIYELVTCKPPLWGESHVNNFICQGGRPKITLEESECPSHFLDLMTLCWSQEPRDRPSMEDIITLVSYPEFSHFMDAISLEAAVVVLASCVFFYNNTEMSVYENLRDMDGSYTQLWLSTRLAEKNMIEVYVFYRNKCVESKFVKHLSVSSLCSSDQYVWGLGNNQVAYIFSPETLLCIQQILLAPGAVTSPLNLHYLSRTKQILATFTDGTVIVCQSEQTISDGFGTEKNQYKVYTLPVPMNTTLCSIVAETRNSCQLWRGYNDSEIGICDITSVLQGLKTNEITEIEESLLDCTNNASRAGCYLLTSWSSILANTHYVFSYVYPGTTIIRWNVITQLEESSIDCHTAIDALSPSKESSCQVTTMNVINSHLYIGTTLGVIIIAEALTMVPLAMLNCHKSSEFYVKSILPLQCETCSIDICTPASTAGVPRSAQSSRDQRGIVTIGRGYVDPFRDLVERLKGSYISTHSGTPVKVPMSVNNSSQAEDLYKRHAFLLSWIAEDWLNY